MFVFDTHDTLGRIFIRFYRRPNFMTYYILDNEMIPVLKYLCFD